MNNDHNFGTVFHDTLSVAKIMTEIVGRQLPLTMLVDNVSAIIRLRHRNVIKMIRYGCN